MKTGKIFWGIILVYLGILVLLNNFDIIDFSWRMVWKFWPVLLIIWGIDILISRENTKKAAILVGLVTCFGLGLLTYFGIKESRSDSRHAHSWGYDGSFDHVEGDGKIFIEDYTANIKKGKVTISGGAGNFSIKDTTEKLIEVRVDKGDGNYILKRTDNDSTVNLNFHAKSEKGISLPSNKVHEMKMYINRAPVWDIDVKVGAADVNLDLSPFKIKDLIFSGGAADVEIKLGNISQFQNVVVEAGVSSIEIKVPASVGCKIVNQSGLSSKTFDGFTQKGSGIYETANYATSAKKIDILLKTGISDLKVKRYQD